MLFELVYSVESYHKNKKGELFIETQCICCAGLKLTGLEDRGQI